MINWEKVCFLDEKNWKGRKIKKAIYINAVVAISLMNGGKLMNLEKGHELDPIWSEFNCLFFLYFVCIARPTCVFDS